jgi:hypothetical protein
MHQYQPRTLTSGRAAVADYSRLPLRPARGQQQPPPQHRARAVDVRQQQYDIQAFDAASASGLQFLQSQLELIDPNIVKPLQETTHARDMPFEIGGGFPDFTSIFGTNYASTGNQGYGLQGTNNTEIAQAQIDLQKGIFPHFNWTSGFTITYIDLEKMATAQRNGMPAPISVQEVYEESVETVWNKMLDGLVYSGFQGNAGLVNNPNVPAAIVNNGAAGASAWASKTPSEILSDVNFGINQTVMNSGYAFKEGTADTLLIPLQPQFAQLTLPMALNGVGWDSTIKYIKANCVAAAYGINFDILPLPNPWISGQGLGSTDRGVMYRKDKKSLYTKIGTKAKKAFTLPTTKDGVGYETVYVGNVSTVVFRRTTTQFYLDGI